MRYSVYPDAYARSRLAISDAELADYLESSGDEIDGFYEAEADSHPYDF